jgi:hypothetical protein
MSFINWGHETPEQKEIRRRMEDRMMFEQVAYNSAMAAAAAAGSSGTRPGSIQFVVDTTNYLEFRLEFTSTNSPIEFTINWGDGTIHEDSGAGGLYDELHTYEEIGEYTVTVTFNKPQNILELNFEGSNDDYANITSITGLQRLRNLEEIGADWNSLVSVDLSNMTNLNYVDISDCETIGSEDPSLTSVNLLGCTSLTELRIDGSDFSAGLPNFRDLQNLIQLDIDNSSLSGIIDISYFPNLERCDLSGNTGITAVTISRSQPIGDNERSLDLYGCSLTQAAVDFILVELSLNGISDGYVYLDGEGNAIPSATGLAAKTVLESRGWNVNINLPPPGYVDISASSDFDIVGDFTIEMFVKFSNLSGYARPYSFGAYPTAANAVSFESGTMYFWANLSGQRSFGPFTPVTGQWYHVCIMRSEDNIALFIDGTRIATYLYADSIPSQGLPLTIGNGNEPNSSLNGLISNFRWTSSALYDTEGFSPPTSQLTDLPETVLLIFQGTTLGALLTDNSGNGHNATGSGTFTYSSDDPFNSAQGSLQVGNV